MEAVIDQRATVFVVDDNTDLQRIISLCLAEDGYLVITAGNAAECLEKLKTNAVDIILLDVLLPDGNGLVLIQKIRALTDVPVIVLSGKNEMDDKIVGLEMGASDYIAKPFEAAELKARIRAHLRQYARLKQQSQTAADDDLDYAQIGKWILNRAKFQIFDNAGKSGDLTVGEFRLLELLATSSNHVLSRKQILDVIKNDNLDVSDRSIDVQIARVRKKIGDNKKSPEFIKTVRSAGYMLVLDEKKAHF